MNVWVENSVITILSLFAYIRYVSKIITAISPKVCTVCTRIVDIIQFIAVIFDKKLTLELLFSMNKRHGFVVRSVGNRILRPEDQI